MTMLRTRLARLESKRFAKTPKYPHLVMELSDGRSLDFFHDPEVLDFLGWGINGPTSTDVEIVGLWGEPRRQ